MRVSSVALSSGVGLIWMMGLVGLSSIPGMGALRTLFLLMGLAHMIQLSRRAKYLAWPGWTHEAGLLALLTAWMVFQAAVISPTPEASLAMLASEWGKWLLMAGVGVWLVVCQTGDAGARWIGLGVFWGYFLHVLQTLAFVIWHRVNGSGWVLGDSFLGNYGYVSPFVTGALAFLIAEGVLRLLGRRWLPFGNFTLLVMFVSTLMAQGVLGAKASLVVSVILFLVAAVALFLTPETRRKAVVLLIGALVTVVASLWMSNRWEGESHGLKAGIQNPVNILSLTDRDPLPPKVGNGSSYQRASWAKIALSGIAEHPLGLGYGSDAFGRYVTNQLSTINAVSSHSGWLDFALANGIPGLVLLLSLAGCAMRRGWRAYRVGHPAGLAAVLVILTFVARGAIDGNLFGSRFTGFAFVAATLWALTFRNDDHPN